MDFLDKLNPQQTKAVTAADGPVLVEQARAPERRGTTHAYCVSYASEGVRPWQIIAVTFTNKAAKEMEHRVKAMLNTRPPKASSCTFHSICARILRRETEHLRSSQIL